MQFHLNKQGLWFQRGRTWNISIIHSRYILMFIHLCFVLYILYPVCVCWVCEHSSDYNLSELIVRHKKDDGWLYVYLPLVYKQFTVGACPGIYRKCDIGRYNEIFCGDLDRHIYVGYTVVAGSLTFVWSDTYSTYFSVPGGTLLWTPCVRLCTFNSRSNFGMATSAGETCGFASIFES